MRVSKIPKRWVVERSFTGWKNAGDFGKIVKEKLTQASK
jgi:hypothetical protein